MTEQTIAISTESAVKTRIRRELVRQLMAVQPGDPIAPIRTTIETLGVSRKMLESVLKEFYEKEMIESRQRQGLFRSPNAAPEHLLPVVDVFLWTATGSPQSERLLRHSFFGDVLQTVASLLSQTNQAFRLHKLSQDYAFKQNDEIVNRSALRACILIHQPEESESSNNILDERAISWVSLFPQSAKENSRYILGAIDIVEKQLKHLWQLGHTKIGYLDGVNMSSITKVALLRRESFYRLMAEKGFRVNPDWVIYAENEDESVLAALSKMFSRKPYPSALILRDAQLAAAYHYFSCNGLIVGKDISIIGTDDLPISEALYPKATTVRLSRMEAAKESIKSLYKVLEGENPQHVYVPSQLIVRNSTCKFQNS